MEADQLLERAAFVEVGVVEAADNDVGECGGRPCADRWPGAFGETACERVLSLDPAFSEVVPPWARSRPPCSAERTSSHPTAGGPAAPDQFGVALLDLLERRRALLPSGRSVRGCPSRARSRRCRPRRSWPARPARGPLPRGLRARASPPARHRHVLLDLAARQGALDQVVEAVAVSLWTSRPASARGRRARRSRRAWARPGGPVRCAQLLVGLRSASIVSAALEAGVVRDLVVAGERRVYRRPPAHHVGEHAEHDQIADDHAHRPAHQRVDPAAMAARPDVSAGRANRGGPFQKDSRRTARTPG